MPGSPWLRRSRLPREEPSAESNAEREGAQHAGSDWTLRQSGGGEDDRARQSDERGMLLGVALLALGPVAARAQNTASATPQGEPHTDPGGKKVLGLADIGRWNRIASATLSANGNWMTYVYQPNEGDGTLYVRALDGGAKTYTIPVGSAPQFSDDSRWVGYFVSPPEAAGRGRGGRGGGGGRGRGAQPPADGSAAGPVRRFELLELSTGDKYPVPDA